MIDFKLINALHWDWETKSVVDLKKYGLDVYSHHPSTEATCAAYRFGDEPIQVWRKGQPIPPRVKAHIEAGGIVIGHKVDFEWAIWNHVMHKKYGWPYLELTQCDCTMARAYAMSMPGSLEKLAPALGVNIGKDMQGRALMLKMSKPRAWVDGKPVWWDETDPEKLERLIKYCIRDVEVESECDKRMMQLSASEKNIWLWDQIINQRGVGIDRDAIQKTDKLVDKVKLRLNGELAEASGGDLTKATEAKKLLAWCRGKGVDIQNLKKRELEGWLNDPDLPYEVREVLSIRQSAAKSSLSKLQTALDMSLVDGRVRGMFQYHGASTGRFAARGVQLHNLPRPEEFMEEPETQAAVIDAIAKGEDDEFVDYWYGPFMRVIVSCIRGYLVAAPGFELIGADLANIEGRVLAWMAGEKWKIEAFRDFDSGTGADLYKLSAQRIYSVALDDVTKTQRLIGKVSELALGYQGAIGAFNSMAANYGVKLPDEQVQAIVDAWRAAHPRTKNFWYSVEDAAKQAVTNPGMKVTAGVKGREVMFRVAGSFLLCKLPSGRVLTYPYPEIQEVDTKWGKKMAVTFMGVDNRVGSPTKGKYIRLSTYGGSLVENIVQAVARDILVGAWKRLEKSGYPIVLHVHDENVSEVIEDFGSVEEYERIMSMGEPWSVGLPIAAAGFRGKRYRK